MASFVSAGHHLKDPGAIGSGTTEARETMQLRDLVAHHLTTKGVRVIIDNDNETLGQYLERIKPGSSSVVCEFHFDAATGKASGATALIGTDADRLDRAFAQEMVDITAKMLGIPNRGVRSEADSHRGRLGLMRETGIVSLIEVCFIDNPEDMAKYQAARGLLAEAYASIIKKYDDLIP